MCGIVGVANRQAPAAPDLYLGLLSMQHRGKESAGLAVSTAEGGVRIEGGEGELPQAFLRAGGRRRQTGSILPRAVDDLPGGFGVGHVRYGTTGAGCLHNMQPIEGRFRGRPFCLVHNGNLVNTDTLRAQAGSPDGCSDSRVIADLVAASPMARFEEAVLSVLEGLQGAFNLIFLHGERLIAVRDPFGFHPLQVGRRGDDWMIASESCAFDMLGATLERDVRPGELVVVDGTGCGSLEWTSRADLRIDLFEYVYFLRPDSRVQGVEAGQARYAMGRALAREHPVDADIVVPVSDSGNHAALGYYEGRQGRNGNLSFRPWALFRPHTVSRTFIEPVQARREQYLRAKFNPRPSELEGRRVVVVDDSIVRANTLHRVVRLLREAGAREVAVVISSPMYAYPDFYGIDTYRIRGELIARRLSGSVPAIARELGDVDYLGYLSLDATIRAVLSTGGPGSDLSEGSFYTGPFTGEYPAGTGDLRPGD